MAESLSRISQWLNEDDTKHHFDKEKGLIAFGTKGDVQTGHFIRIKEEGKMFTWQVQLQVDDGNFSVPEDHKHILVLLKYLLHENYTTKFGCWEYDSEDGDIRYAVEIPLEDAKMTQEQFKRICSLMFSNVDTMMNKVLQICETGEVPKEEDRMAKLAEQLKAAMDRGELAPKKEASSVIDIDDGI